MQVLMNSGGVAMTNAWVVADEQAKQAVLFDAPDHTAGRLLDEVEKRGWELAGLWLTHAHFDHIAEHALIKERFADAKVLIHALEADGLRRPHSALWNLPFTIPPGEPDGLVEDGQVLHIGSIEVRVMHTPGHSPGHVMYHMPQERVLIGGDLIICNAVGRTDLPGCNQADLEASIRKVMQLPDDTQLLPGHCDPSTLGEERATNLYVRAAL